MIMNRPMNRMLNMMKRVSFFESFRWRQINFENEKNKVAAHHLLRLGRCSTYQRTSQETRHATQGTRSIKRETEWNFWNMNKTGHGAHDTRNIVWSEWKGNGDMRVRNNNMIVPYSWKHLKSNENEQNEYGSDVDCGQYGVGYRLAWSRQERRLAGSQECMPSVSEANHSSSRKNGTEWKKRNETMHNAWETSVDEYITCFKFSIFEFEISALFRKPFWRRQGTQPFNQNEKKFLCRTRSELELSTWWISWLCVTSTNASL